MNNSYYPLIICFLVGYIIGNINPAYLIGLTKGFDIRTRGSGNPGASNAMLILGKKAGVFCALFDIFKGFAAYKIGFMLYPDIHIAGMISGIACVLGHMYPALLKFKGGKGLASIAGVALAYDLKIFGILLLIEIVIAFTTNYISMVPTTGSVIFFVILYFIEGLPYALLILPALLTIWYKHLINFKRIRYGVEGKIESFWNKKKDKERLKNNWDKLTEEERIYVDMKEFTF